jgi:hypothetical protein
MFAAIEASENTSFGNAQDKLKSVSQVTPFRDTLIIDSIDFNPDLKGIGFFRCECFEARQGIVRLTGLR